MNELIEAYINATAVVDKLNVDLVKEIREDLRFLRNESSSSLHGRFDMINSRLNLLLAFKKG